MVGGSNESISERMSSSMLSSMADDEELLSDESRSLPPPRPK